MKYRFTIVVVIVIALLGSVFAFAEESNPGDSLYEIKTSIIEPIASVFAFTKEEKSEWQERLIERRLKESEKLASVNELSEARRVSIENSIKTQLEKFSTNVKDLVSQKDDAKETSDLCLRLQAVLATYQNILEQVSQKTDINESTKKEIVTLLSTLKEVESEVMGYQKNIESNITEEKQKVLEESLYATKLLYQKNKLRLYDNTPNEINAKLAEVEKLISEIKFLNSSGTSLQVDEKFQSALTLIDEVKISIFSNLIQEDLRHKGDWDNEEEHKGFND